MSQDLHVASWTTLHDLAAKARAAENEESLLFTIANETFALAAYRSALVFTIHEDEPVLSCASGLTLIDRRSAFGSWAEQVLKVFLPQLSKAQVLTARDLPQELQSAWGDYWSSDVIVYPVPARDGRLLAAVVYVGAEPWSDDLRSMIALLHQFHALALLQLRAQKDPLEAIKKILDGRNLKTRRYLIRIALAVFCLFLIPIKQFIIAPVEIISLDSMAVTIPVEGFVAEMVAKPNQAVQKGDVLVRLDDTAIRNRLESARHSLEVARAEYLAGAHRAFVATDKVAEAGVLRGRINERLAEVAFLEDQLSMLEVRAPRAGIVVYGQENDWLGKPVSAGQRIMELADPSKPGVNIWVPVADAINLRSGESVYVLLVANPLNPLSAIIEQSSYMALKSPDGISAYRVRAGLPPQSNVRLGLRGNAKINGDWVVLGYFIFRRPLTVVRQWIGI